MIQPRHDDHSDPQVETATAGAIAEKPRAGSRRQSHEPTGAVTSQLAHGQAPAEDARRWRDLLEKIDQGFCIFEMIYDADGAPVDYRFLEVNPTFERHTGLKDAVGRTARELVPNLEMEWVRIYAQVAEGEGPMRFEQGSAAMGRWFEVEAVPVGGFGRREVALLFTDITARRLAEADTRFVKAVNEQIRVAAQGDALLWTVTEMLGRHLQVARCCFIEVDEAADRWVIHRDYRDTTALPSLAGARALSAYPDELLRGLRAGRVVTVGDTTSDPQTEEYDESGFRPLGARAFVCVPLLREGVWVGAFAAFAVEPRAWSQREVALLEAVVGQAWSAVEQLRTLERLLASQQALARANHRLTFALDRLDGFLYDYDLDTGYIERSSGFARVLGYDLAEVPPHSDWWGLRIHPDDHAAAIAEGRAAQDGGEASYSLEYRVRHRDGRYLTVWDRGQIERDAAGRARRVLGTTINITERKRGEAERAALLAQVQEALQATSTALARAEEATRERDLLISIAAHDLRSPLTAILGQAQLLQRRVGDGLDERGQRALGTIAQQAERLNRMIGALLDLSRIQEGRLTIEPQPVDLVTLLERVVGEARLTASAHDLALSAPPAPLTIIADPLRLEQVLHNLLGNAIKYSPDGGPIEIAIELEGEAVRILVRDQGIGIPAAALPHLFTRFYRAPNADAQATSSMGVGLYVVRELVQAHGGTVSVESSEGAGSTFVVRLPLKL